VYGRAIDSTRSGALATVDGRRLAVGNARLLEREQVPLDGLAAKAVELADEGRTVVHAAVDGRAVALIAVADAVRETALEAVNALKELGIRPVMLTGDNRATAERIAAEVGIEEVLADVLPGDKAAKVAELQAEGRKVAMVGDGVNDAPALARANVGIAIGAGTDVAIASAGVVLATSDPRAVVSVRKLSKASYGKMVQNLAWAAGYNIVAIPLAAGVLAPIGFVLSPAVGAVLMSLSTIVVALNAQLLRRVDLSLERAPHA